MIARHAADTIRRLAKGFPVLCITGPRQSGKTTLAKARAISVILVSGLPPETVRKFGMLPAAGISEALAAAYEILGSAPRRTFVFPYGSLTIPRIRS